MYTLQNEFDDDLLADNPWYAVVQRRTARGGKYTFLRFHQEGVRVLLLDGQGRVLLVKQFREPLQRELWEIPAGGVDIGESPLEAAQRELLEEAGLVAHDWRQLGRTAGLVNVTDFQASLFLAQRPAEGPPRAATNETTETTCHRFFTRSQLDALIAAGDLCDDKTLAALHLAERAGFAIA